MRYKSDSYISVNHNTSIWLSILSFIKRHTTKIQKHCRKTHRVVDEATDIAIDTSIDREERLRVMIVEVQQVRHGIAIIHLATPLSFLVCYHLD